MSPTDYWLAPPDWPCVLFTAAAPVSDFVRQSLGSALPGLADSSQRMSLRATCFLLAFTLDLSVLAAVEPAAAPLVVALMPVAPLPLYASAPLRDDVLLSLIGLGLSAVVPLPLETEPLALRDADRVVVVVAEVEPLSVVPLLTVAGTPTRAGPR